MLNEETSRLIEQMGSRAQEMAEEIQKVSGVASDDDELVTATCGPGNRLVDIDFDPRSRRLDTHELKQKVIVAVQRAGDEAQKQMTEAINNFSSQFSGQKGIDMSEFNRTMDEMGEKIAEQKAKLEAMYEDLKTQN